MTADHDDVKRLDEVPPPERIEFIPGSAEDETADTPVPDEPDPAEEPAVDPGNEESTP